MTSICSFSLLFVIRFPVVSPSLVSAYHFKGFGTIVLFSTPLKDEGKSIIHRAIHSRIDQYSNAGRVSVVT